MFTPLRIISGYSFLQSGLTIDKIIDSVKSNKYFGAGLADFSILYGAPEFAHKMSSINKPFLIGMSFELNNFSLVAYVLNEDGYRNLCLITNEIALERFTDDFLKEHHAGLLGVLETNYLLFKDEYAKEETSFLKKLEKISTCFDEFYLGVEVTSKEEFANAKKIRLFADKYTYSTIAFPRIRYQKKEDAIVLKIVDAIKYDTKLKEKEALGQEYFFPESYYQKIYTKSEIELTNEVIKKSNFEFVKKRGEMFRFPCENSDEYLKSLVHKCLKERNLETQEYIDRANYELDIIKKMGYSDYFLIVQDYVNYAKNNGIIVGSGRGSAAGALVSYLLNITEVDPLKYDLMFERFLNIGRNTMPDIDVDFMDSRRDEIVQYMKEKYGTEHVTNIVTFQTILAKQALRDIGRIYDIPTSHIDLLAKRLTNDDYGLRDSYRHLPAFKEIVDSDKYFLDIVSLASKIEYLPRQNGLHAAGILLNYEPIQHVMPITVDISDNYIAQYDKDYIEEQGFLKMDFLSLRNLTIIDYCLKLINKNHNLNLTFETIPFENKEIFELISKGYTMGIFELEQSSMKNSIKTLQPSCFDDVVALNALSRPGPMENIPSYARRKQGKEKITYLSEALKKTLSPTYGIIVYQEQVNQIATTMAGFTLSEADLFRRAISKKNKEKMLELKEKFINGAIKQGYKKNEAEQTFALLEKFADYGFNKSHSVAYSIISCRMGYLKVFYPLEFYAGILLYCSSSSDSKFNEYIAEMKARNINLLPPDINVSTLEYQIVNNALCFPLSAIKGINNQFVTMILKEREDGPFLDFSNFVIRMYKYQLNEKQLLKLIDAGVFDSLNPSRASLRISSKAALQYANLNYSDIGQLTIDPSLIPPPVLYNEEDDPIYNLNQEYEALGIMLSGNPLEYKRDLLNKKNVISIVDCKNAKNPTIAGIIRTKKVINTKKGTPMAFVKIFDETGEIELTIFSDLYSKVLNYIEKNNIIIVKGRYELSRREESFVASEIELLEE